MVSDMLMDAFKERDRYIDIRIEQVSSSSINDAFRPIPKSSFACFESSFSLTILH